MLPLPFDVETLLQPLGEADESGVDRAYEAPFAALDQAVAGKPERQYGEKVYPAEPPDWPSVYEQALALAGSTRDLRVGIWVLRSATRLHGLAGAAAGLLLLNGLLERLWPSVHPQLDASDADDPTMRLNALMPLTAADAVLADLRSAALGSARGSLTLRELELGLRRAEPLPGEVVPTEAGVRAALTELGLRQPELPELAAAALRATEGIEATLTQRVGAALAPELTPVLRLTKMLEAAVSGQPDAFDSAAPGDEEGEKERAGLRGPEGAGSGGIRSRADAIRELDRVCAWLEQHEPANPAPLLIRRAQRLMNKSFMEIIRDLAPDGVAQIENLAGPDGSA